MLQRFFPDHELILVDSLTRISIRTCRLLFHFDLLLTLLHDLPYAHIIHIGGAKHGLIGRYFAVIFGVGA